MEITSRELQLLSLKVLRGPNQWASFPVLEAWVDLGRLEDFPSHTIPGFNERIMAWLPSMIEHRCSIGERGGFFERLRTGTWMGHVLEHVTLELQTLSGTPVGYGRAREAKTRGVYKVVIEYKEEKFAVECLHAAHRLLMAAIDGTDFDVAAETKRLRKVLLDVQLGPSTRSIVDAAVARGIPARRLTDGSLVRLGIGAKQRRSIAAETDRTGAVAESIAQDKELTRTLLAEAGIPVPEGRPVVDAADAWAVAEEIGAPVVVKPRYGNQGRGVSVDLSTREEVEKAWSVAREESTVVVERFVAGGDYRVLVVGGKVVAAARRHPPTVVGDGRSTVRQLVERVNEDPRRCCDHAGALSPVRIDEVALAVLAEQGLAPESVPAADHTVLLRQNANLSTGGTSEDVTDVVHPEVAARAVEAARIVGLDVAGIDIVTADITQSLESQRGVVIEVNAGPGLRMHLEPTVGTPRNVGAAIVDTLFGPGDEGRIPVAAVTGTNGKSTVVRLLSHLATSGGATVGTSCTEGVWVGGRQIDAGDCSGPASARRILANPSVTTAVLETARGGILREGCGFDYCDVAVVTNIAEGDHLGLGEIDTPEQLAWVKGAIVAGVRPVTGTAVLNAADPLVVGMKKWCKGQVVYFALDPANPLVVEHLAQGGLAATVRDGWIVLCDGPRETRLANLDRVPLVHRGLVPFQVENALAAAAAAWRLGVPLELVRLGLETFASGSGGSPGRFNLLELEGASIVVDYGHNVPSLEQICATIRNLPHPRRTAVYSAAGDRRDEDLIRQGELLAATFDRVVIYEDAYIRGRQPGEITALISKGIQAGLRADRPTAIEFGGNWCEAAALVLDAVRAGDLVLLQPDTVDQTVEWLAERYGQRVRETQFDQMAGLVVRDADTRLPAPHEPVEVRSGRQGRTVMAVRPIAVGETVLRAWGPQAARRSRHSMQVDVDTHILPDGVMVLVNHSCEPNCGVQIRLASREIEVRALRPIAAGEEITLDYNTFEYELDQGGGQCTCGAAGCRGRVPGFKHLAAEVKARYGEYIAEYLR
ncbi:MAG: cyanophycin synthetase, partial [Planctomycetia bacterium]